MHLPKGHVLDTSGILDYLDTQASPVAKYLYILSYFVLLKDIFFCFLFFSGLDFYYHHLIFFFISLFDEC